MFQIKQNWKRYAAIALLGLPVAGAQAVTTGLVGYYDFESSLSNKATTSFNPTVIGGTPTAGVAGGLVGNALDLDKAQFDAIRVPITTANLGQNFSISAWFKNEFVGTDSSRSFVFEAADNFDVSLGTSSAAGPDTYTHYVAQTSAGSSSLQRSDWNHVVHAFSSDGTNSTVEVYVNGALTHTKSALTSAMNFTNLNIGKARDGTGTGVASGRYFEGQIDEVAIWNRTITASEATEVHSRGVNGLGLFDQDTTTPVRKYVFNADGTEPDASIGASITLAGWTDNSTFAHVTGANNDLGDGGFSGEYFRTTGALAAASPNGNHTLTIQLNNLDGHSAIDLGMLVAQIDSLDAFRDGERFIVKLDGVELLNVGFSYGSGGSFTDGPGNVFATTGDPILDAELLAIRTIASTNVTGDTVFRENLYDLSQLSIFQNIAHSSSSLTLEIIGRQNQTSGEFYGMDDISITLLGAAIIPEPASISLLAMAGLALLRRRR